MKKTILACLLFIPLTTFAADPLIEAFRPFIKINAQSSEFDKWTHDAALLTIQTCWMGENPHKTLPSELNTFPLKSGSWISPTVEEQKSLCSSILNYGIKPVCTHSQTMIKNGSKTGIYPSEYLVASSKQSRFEIQGTLSCYLNNQQVQAQSYTPDKWIVQWLSQPKPENITLPTGTQQVNMGHVLLKVNAPGLNGSYSEPKIVIFTP